MSSFAGVCDDLQKMKSDLLIENDNLSDSIALVAGESEAIYLRGESSGEHPLSMESRAVVFETREFAMTNTLKANTDSLKRVDQNLKNFCGIVTL